ncbi:unnamed protein product [Pseudo-nitzschia multistriata]|uniref:GATA-type domain-containing protein n=1 Tax=Pseudo-nitzschia multistriata TaxID=183589 RepID=A0A448YZT3_9STRA|nr:unnamed protein product [Pseudo-nitzschia multistriata]
MSFYFDDDNDDQAFSQPFRSQLSSVLSSQTQTPTKTKTPPEDSQRSQVTFAGDSQVFSFSQSPLVPKSDPSSYQLSEAVASQLLLSRASSLCKSIPTKRDPGDKPKTSNSTFVCQNCGAIDDYYRDEAAGGVLTCSSCFTQSQACIEEEFDYEDGQNMGVRNRDGTLQKLQKAPSASGGTGKVGFVHRSVPIEELDRSKPPPSLEACLGGFGAVLRASCKTMCLELMAVPVPADETSAGKESRWRQKLYRRVSGTARDLWRAYLLSWKEGADFYGEFYPQIRFSLRDSFLSRGHKMILYSTLAARARVLLAERVHSEANDQDGGAGETEDGSVLGNDDDNDDADDDSDSLSSEEEDEGGHRRGRKRIKTKHKAQDDSGDRKDQTKESEMDVLLNLFEQHDEKGSRDNRKKERPKGKAQKPADHDVPVPNVVLSANRSQRRFSESESNTALDGSESGDENKNHASDDEEGDGERQNGTDDDKLSVASDVSVLDGNTFEHDPMQSTSSWSLKKRKLICQKESLCAKSGHVLDKMLLYHFKELAKKAPSVSSSKKNGKNPRQTFFVGRKEAALLLRPSMVMVAGILLVAAGPHGVTEGMMIEWIENGSLPLLRAFDTLLPKDQREPLAMVAPFFCLPLAPSTTVLRNTVKKVHVACGYRPPKIKLVAPRNFPDPPLPTLEGAGAGAHPVTPPPATRERILTKQSLYAPGRLIRPSTVPLLLGHFVSELGFSQLVLNYSLALAGLAVSNQSLPAAGAGEETPWIVPDDYEEEEEEKPPPAPRPQKKPRPERKSIHVAMDLPKKLVEENAEAWDEESAPVFDLSKPQDRIRRHRYRNRLYQRLWKKRKLARLGKTKQAYKLNYRYRVSAGGDGDDSDDDSDDDTDDDNHDDDHDETGGERSKDTIPKRRRTWLPRPIRGARSDRLGDVHRILAVVVMACKLVPNWDENHRYVFSRGGDKSHHNSNGGKPSSGITTAENSKNHSARAMDRFVPFNRDHFGYIGNGKTETDYLNFLEEFIFRGKSYALPKLVESLKEASSEGDGDANVPDVDDDKASSDRCLVEESDDEEPEDQNDRTCSDITVVVPNDTVVEWRSRRKENNTGCLVGSKRKFQCWTRPKVDSVPYRLTTVTDTKSLRTLDSPLGSLIEYIAYKTETQPDLILQQLILLDKEMSVKYRRSMKKCDRVAPSQIYKFVMGRKKKKKSKVLAVDNECQGTPAKANLLTDDANDDKTVDCSNHARLETISLLSPLQFNDVLAQESPEIGEGPDMDDVWSVGERACV